MTTVTGPRPMTDAEREAWTLHLQKVPVPTIQARTGLVPSQIAAAVDLGQVHARARLEASPAVMLEPAPPVVSVKQAAKALPATPPPAAGDGYMTITKLLSWAEQSQVSRAVTLAARVREYLAEMRNLQEQHDARTRAQAEVDRLTAELSAAKDALRRSGGSSNTRSSGVKPTGELRARATAIRAWAPGAGYELSPLGRIPRHVEAAYDQAHPEAS